MTDLLEPPAIILGNARSGTTLLQYLIADALDMHPWYEPRLTWMYADPLREHDRFERSDASPRVASYIRRRWQKLRLKVGKPIIEKTPSNLLRIPFIDAIFPNARFIYIVRHPLAQISSNAKQRPAGVSVRRALTRLSDAPLSQLPIYAYEFARHRIAATFRHETLPPWGPRYPGMRKDQLQLSTLELLAKQWEISSQIARQDLACIDHDRVVRFRYEDLLENPDEIIRQVSSLLERPVVNRNWRSAFEARNTELAHVKWQRFSPVELEGLRRFIDTEMAFYGYAFPSPSELRNISEGQRHLAESLAEDTTSGRRGVANFGSWPHRTK